MRRGRGVRVPRAQRRRQVLDDADGRLRLAGHRGRADDLRPRPGPRRSADPRAARRGPAEGHPRRGAHASRRTSGSTAATSACPAPRSRERADELLEFAQLSDRPTSKVEPLSGGMKRRLTIARSLINEPDMLLLDEPTTGLDPQARHVLWDRLFRLKRQGVTLIVTTHYMDEAEQLCDRLVVMDKGRIVAEGSPARLIDAHSTREVLELRFDVGRARRGDRRPPRAGSATRVEVLPDRILVYAATATPPSPRSPVEAATDLGPGAALHAGGRLPPPHRPHPGRLTWRRTSSPRSPVPPPNRPAPPAGRSLAVRLRVPAAGLPTDLARQPHDQGADAGPLPVVHGRGSGLSWSTARRRDRGRRSTSRTCSSSSPRSSP